MYKWLGVLNGRKQIRAVSSSSAILSRMDFVFSNSNAIELKQQVALESPTSFALPDVSMANLSEIALTLLNVTPSDFSYVVSRFTENVVCLCELLIRTLPISKNS